jgi:hypothetical protein
MGSCTHGSQMGCRAPYLLHSMSMKERVILEDASSLKLCKIQKILILIF